MENSRLTWRLFYIVVSLLLLGAITQAQELTEGEENVENEEISTDTEDTGETIYERRQDKDGFSLYKYFLNGGFNQQQQQQQGQAQTVVNSNVPVHPVGQDRLALQTGQEQQQALQAYYKHTNHPQQQIQQVQPYQANQQQFIGAQTGGNQHVAQQQRQPVESLANRDGYGAQEVIKFESTPGTRLGNLWRIMRILSAGGKVVMGLELGNNFYFGPVGVKPEYR